MKTKRESQECSVTVAFAELNRLEQDRAEGVAAKQVVRERLAGQGRELEKLRGRLEAERPKALARVRRDRLRREQLREQLSARLIAEATSAHDERLGLIRAELEAKRLRLAALEAATEVPRASRRWLEWSVPIAASAMVAFLAFTLFDEEQAVAQPAAVAQVEHVASEVVELADEQAPEPEPVAEPEPEPEPEPVAPAPSKKKTTKSKTSKKKTTDKKPEAKPKTETKPVVKKNSKPLEIGDFDGNPLG